VNYRPAIVDCEQCGDATPVDQLRTDDVTGLAVCPPCDRGEGSRALRPDGGADDGIQCCPECESSDISVRAPGPRAPTRHSDQSKTSGARWRCRECGHRFDEPDRRPSRRGRSASHLAAKLADPDVGPDDVLPDGGSVTSEWTLTCLDCDWRQTVSATGHPRDGPPDDVEAAVTRHKHTSPGDHVVRVAGRIDDDGDDLDPSLLTDGGRATARERLNRGSGDWSYGDSNRGPGVPWTVRRGGATSPMQRIELDGNGVAYEGDSAEYECAGCGTWRRFVTSAFALQFNCPVCNDLCWFVFEFERNRVGTDGGDGE
jgi:hypothetical protein